MSTTEDTSAIDEKKNEETPTSITSDDFKKFIINYLSSIVFTIGISIFVIGTIGLFTTKVAQANILPDNIELAPYTVFDRIVENKPIDINIMRPSFFSENKDTLSQKTVFNSQKYLDSFNKSFLCSLKENANDPKGGMSASASLFFSSVYNNIVAKNFLAINTIFYYLSYLPESAIMIIYGFFGIFIWMALYFFNVCISIFYHIICIPELFRNPATDTDTETKWQSNEEISFFSVKLLLFCFIWWWIGLISVFITPIFFTLYGLISPLFATYKVKNNQMNIGDFIKNTFAYKQFFFIILATISLFSNGITYLGNNSIVGIVLAVVFAYFMGFYANEMPTYVDGFSYKIRQNIKPSTVKSISNKYPELVEICKPIPIENKKLNEKIRAGEYRNLTTNNDVGGSTYVESSPVPFVESTPVPLAELMPFEDPSAPSDKMMNNPSAPQLTDNIKQPTAPVTQTTPETVTTPATQTTPETVTAPVTVTTPETVREYSQFDEPENQFPMNGGNGKGKRKTKQYQIRFV